MRNKLYNKQQQNYDRVSIASCKPLSRGGCLTTPTSQLTIFRLNTVMLNSDRDRDRDLAVSVVVGEACALRLLRQRLR